MSIVIFSRPIHSGKTTELLHWCNKQKNIDGVLMPDMNGSRKILHIRTKEIVDVECVDIIINKEPLISIGRFNFYSRAFEKANEILVDALAQHPYWLVIDEAGKLELDEKGFYQAIVKAVEVYDTGSKPGNLLITVRESLCSDVIVFFNLRNYSIIYRLEELSGRQHQ